ncbi:MFS transporter [Massilia sp. H6]|uniref:MFS transporter n=1 Tax=Massilia sp. H6 TaxID=2970464 RepID=UPI002169DCA4|nr:MFS transporter [Massilia sp. H6]UVW30226.1 MFS transporter [Massilia sp. H6]
MQDQLCSAEPTDVQDFLNQHRFSPFQWLIFGLCFVIVLLDGFDTAAIGFIAPSLIAQWGVSRQDLAPVLSAALFGLASGALFAGPLSDRFGRKLVLAVSVLLFGLACTWSAFATDLTELATLRFVTGIGLGAAMPNAVTLMSEYCPERKRSMLTNAMFCGFPLGAACGGFLAAWMIPQWGWRSVLLLGGVAPVLVSIVVVLLLPESVRFLLARGGRQDKVRATLRRIAPSAAQASAFVMTEKAPSTHASGGLGVIVAPPYLVGTLMLWLSYFMGLVIFYSLINWMPLLFKDAGLSPRDATLVAALFPLGGVGAVFSGWLMDRYNANAVTAAGFALTAASIFAIGHSAGGLGLLMGVVFVAGVAMNTAQCSLPSLAASFYPTRGRATGVSWMMGVGRLGGIAGSFLVAELARRQFGFDGIFAVVALAGVAATIALLVKMALEPGRA